MKAFNDTNVSIAYVFLFEVHNTIAKHIFQEYDDLYWSSRVFDEFLDRVGEKQDHLLSFYEKLEMELYFYRKLYFNFSQLEDFANNFSFKDYKHKKEVMESLEPFWNYYFQHSNECVSENMMDSVSDFNIFLKTTVFERMDFCEDLYVLTDDFHERTEDYPDLREVLTENGVHDEDILIALDAHDFSKTFDIPLDFITFDINFCNGVSKSNLCFNNVKCLKDYDFLT